MSLFTALKTEISFDGTNWVDMTSRLANVDVTIRQGRATAFSAISPGVLTLSFTNDDGDLTPDNPLSSHYPNVTEGKQIRVKLVHATGTYTRFWGTITSWEPSFPTDGTVGGQVAVSAIDNLGILARQKSMSAWAAAARYYSAGAAGGVHWDAWRISGDGFATGAFVNIATDGGTLATATVVHPSSPASGGVGSLSYGTADGLSIEGSILFAPAVSHYCDTVKIQTSAGAVRAFDVWIRLPGYTQTTAGVPQYDVVRFYNAVGASLGAMRITYNAGEDDLGWFDATGTFVGPALAFNTPTARWVLLTMRTKTATPTTTDVTWDGGGTTNLAFDLRLVDSIWLGGVGTNVPAMEIAGPVLSASELGTTSSPPDGVISTTKTVQDAANLLAWITPKAVATAAGGDYTGNACVGVWHDIDFATIATDLTRAAGNGFPWARSRDSTVYLVSGDLTYPRTPVLTIDADGDLIGAPTLRRAIEDRPTRVRVTFPTGEVSVVDAGAEVLSGGAVREDTINAQTADASTAQLAGSAYLSTVNQGLRVTNLTLDLESPSSGVDPVPTVFDESSTLGGLYPTQRLRLTLPSATFGVTYKDVHVQGWTETYSPYQRAQIAFDLTPEGPNRGIFDDATRDKFGADGALTVTGGTAVGSTSNGTLVITSTGTTLTTTSSAYPMDLDWNGERVTITSAPAGSTSPQTVTTSSRGVAPSVARSHAAGETVDVWHPAAWTY